jgi:hypothetical protein
MPATPGFPPLASGSHVFLIHSAANGEYAKSLHALHMMRKDP